VLSTSQGILHQDTQEGQQRETSNNTEKGKHQTGPARVVKRMKTRKKQVKQPTNVAADGLDRYAANKSIVSFSTASQVETRRKVNDYARQLTPMPNLWPKQILASCMHETALF